MKRNVVLDLDNLQAKAPGLTPAIANYLREACIVCLQHNGHGPGRPLLVEGSLAPQGNHPVLQWSKTLPPNAKQAHADLQDATANGAIAIAALLVAEFTPFHIVERAPKGRGFDYFLAPKDSHQREDDLNFLDGTYHLEVSGILRESQSNSRKRRLLEKKRRFQRLGTQGQNIIVIVAFDGPAATMEDDK